MAAAPVGFLGRSGNDIGWQPTLVDFVARPTSRCVSLYLVLARVPEGVTHRFKVHKQVGNEFSTQRKGPSVENGMALVQDHVSRFHGNVVGASVVSNDFERPRFVQVGIDVDNGRADQGESIDVCAENGSLCVDTDTVQRALIQLLLGPFLDSFLGGVPELLFETVATPAQTRVFNIDNACG